MIDENLSHLSDLAFEGAMAGYLVALVCHGVQTAAQKTRVSKQDRVAVGVGAGSGGLGTAGDDAQRDAGSPVGKRPTLGELFGRAAIIVTVVGFVCHIAALVLRGFAAGRGPWGNMYEFTLMITGAAVATWLVMLWRTNARQIGIYVMTPITVLVFLAGTVLYTQSAPLMPILNTYWLHIHVIAISLSSGVLMLSGLASSAYLVRESYDRKVTEAVMAGEEAPDGLGAKLPHLDKLDRIAYRSAISAFPFFTFAIIAGALWAEVAWGAYWSWDPKEVVALVSWVVYAGYLHARATAGWRGRPAAWISVVGLATIIFNLFFVNIVISGMHSYAGLN